MLSILDYLKTANDTFYNRFWQIREDNRRQQLETSLMTLITQVLPIYWRGRQVDNSLLPHIQGNWETHIQSWTSHTAEWTKKNSRRVISLLSPVKYTMCSHPIFSFFKYFFFILAKISLKKFSLQFKNSILFLSNNKFPVYNCCRKFVFNFYLCYRDCITYRSASISPPVCDLISPTWSADQ